MCFSKIPALFKTVCFLVLHWAISLALEKGSCSWQILSIIVVVSNYITNTFPKPFEVEIDWAPWARRREKTGLWAASMCRWQFITEEPDPCIQIIVKHENERAIGIRQGNRFMFRKICCTLKLSDHVSWYRTAPFGRGGLLHLSKDHCLGAYAWDSPGSSPRENRPCLKTKGNHLMEKQEKSSEKGENIRQHEMHHSSWKKSIVWRT